MRAIIAEKILPHIQKPARYLGTEWNSVHKDWDTVNVRMAFAFPDVYEIGMSHLGMRILYHIVNNRKDALMERVFAPWVDMEEKLRELGLPLFSLESHRPLGDFDIVAFTLQYEMSYTNILNMLALSRIPILASERIDGDPLVIAGGPCAYNPEPLALFFDAIVIGEGEEVIHDILDIYKKGKAYMGAGGPRQAQTKPASAKQTKPAPARKELLAALASVPGVYVPSFYEDRYSEAGVLKETVPIHAAAPPVIHKRVVADLDKASFPEKPIVPFMEVAHDRIMLEVLRGCSRGCRFCQAGSVYRPVRERAPETLLRQAENLVRNTGYEDISLTSLSTADYTCVQGVLAALMDRYAEEGVSISLPSLRVDSFSVDLAKEVQRVKRTTLTFAPEAGTQRLRDVINKGVTEEDLIQAVKAAFEAGWSGVKLYFMIGLPTETDEDIEGIARLAYRVLDVYKQVAAEKAAQKGGKGGGRQPKITVSASSFVPKAHTAFQWEPQASMDELRGKQDLLKKTLRDRRLVFNWHDVETSFIEAVLARGDRRVGRALYRAWELGCKFDSWTEFFHFDLWQRAFTETGISPAFYANRAFTQDEALPWDHIDAGLSKSYLQREHEKALAGEVTMDCRWASCEGCGVCPALDLAVDLKSGANALKDGGDSLAHPV